MYDASRKLQKPLLHFVPHTDIFCLANGRLAISAAERRWTDPTLSTLTTSFDAAWKKTENSAISSLMEVIVLLADFTIIIENFVEGRFVPRIPAVLTDQRNYVHHRLLSLDSANDLESQEDAMAIDPQYEPCRLACIIYSFLVVYPYPPIVGLYERLIRRLQASILAMRLKLDDMNEARLALQLWMLVMGAILAVGLPQRDWFMKDMSPILLRLGISGQAHLTTLLIRFLWHPNTSGRDLVDLCRELRTGPPHEKFSLV
jgi:hypothetical protein